MALGAMSPPEVNTPGQSLGVIPNEGLDGTAIKMNPMDSMMMVFEDMRDGIAKIPEAIFELKDQVKTSISNLNKHLAYRFAELTKAAQTQMTGTAPEQPTADEMVADADADLIGDPEETDSQGNDEGGGFSLPKIPKPGPKLGLALLLGGLATLMAFGDKMVPYIAPVLKFLKEKALPMAIDAFKLVLEGVKTVFNYLYENVWPFIKDNVIMNAVDYVKDTFQAIKDLFSDLGDRFGVLFSDDATWWEKITAFLGIFTDIGQFFIDQFDRVTEFIANVFGVSFAPYDGLISFIGGKLGEAFDAVVTWFSETGTFLLEGATGIWNWITGMIDKVWTSIGEWFVSTDKYLHDGATGIWDWITGKINAVWTGITEWFSQMGTFLADGAAGIWDWITGKIDGAWQVITSWFGFGSEEESGEPSFSITGWIGEKASELWNKLTGFFKFGKDDTSFNIPNIGDAFMNMIGKMLPSPDKWIGKALYSLPGTGTLKKAAEMFAAGGSIEGGKMVMPGTAEDTLAQGSGVEKSALEQIKRNQRNMDIYDDYDSDKVLRDGSTIEDKLFDLEMQNIELASQLTGAELKKLQEFQERQGFAQGGGIAVNTFNTDNSATDMSNTNAAAEYRVEGTDSTARALAYYGSSDTGEY